MPHLGHAPQEQPSDSNVVFDKPDTTGPAEHGGLWGCSPPTFLQSNENENHELYVSLKKVLNQPPTQNFVPLSLYKLN